MAGRKTAPWRVGISVIAASAAVAAFGLAGAAGAGPAAPRPPGPSATIDAETVSPYGPILVATFTGHKLSLYEISSDHPPVFGCTTVVEPTFEGTFPCTGPFAFATPTTSEWPALTSTGPVVVGPGVNRFLVGTVRRPGVGNQVTYAGHPLYLFPTPTRAPTTFFGEGFLETVLPVPPWHGLWDLVSAASGNPASGDAVLEPGTTPTHGTVLSVKEYPGVGGFAIAVYEFCPGQAGPGQGHGPWAVPLGCKPGGLPSAPGSPPLSVGPPGLGTANWIPVLTQGAPTAAGGVTAGSLGTVRTSEGTQVTFDGRPLYIYSSEMAVWTPPYDPSSPTSPLTTGTAGNGAGEPGPGGTATLIPLS